MPGDAGNRRLVRVPGPGTMASHPPPQLTCPSGTRKASNRSPSPSVASSPESLTRDVNPVTGVKPEMDFPSFQNSQVQGYLTLGDKGFDGIWGWDLGMGLVASMVVLQFSSRKEV
ncbi:hypothetical protein V6N12_070284 [Hibiscus sabdariffa]|uniref:Uncharacterized protein n=1 Tax=Hibiscus sabdariffa TaxID=183260 RepID=A0ABR2FGN0_9ROSI